jgi:Fe-S-cluster containining protein
MNIPVQQQDSHGATTDISCSNCKACCCRLEVLLIDDPDVPDHFVSENDWGGQVMLRLKDGWCAALDRRTMMCRIYDARPQICRDFEEASPECQDERKAHLS